MSVLIRGMKMPKNCLECEIKAWGEDFNEHVCPFSGILCLSIGRQDDCPLVELPEKLSCPKFVRSVVRRLTGRASNDTGRSD